jgi:hypothetical protein
MQAFWDITPCSLVEVDLRFRDAYCIHHQDDDHLDDGGSTHPLIVGVLQQDYTALYRRRLVIFAAMRTWNLTNIGLMWGLTYIDGFCEKCPNELWVKLDEDGEYNGGDEETYAEDEVDDT